MRFERHSEHLVSEADIVVDLRMSLCEARAKAFLKCANATAQVSLIYPKVLVLIFLIFFDARCRCNHGLSELLNHFAELLMNLTCHRLDDILAELVHERGDSRILSELFLQQLERLNVLPALLQALHREEDHEKPLLPRASEALITVLEELQGGFVRVSVVLARLLQVVDRLILAILGRALPSQVLDTA